jgi:hypothetical protein
MNSQPLSVHHTMTDREMLKAAARAAGFKVESFTAGGDCWAYEAGASLNSDGEPPIFKWAPLTDDGDALRLAVKKKIRVVCGDLRVCCDWWAEDGITLRILEHIIGLGCDRDAATRRAIVCAAAEMAA